MSIQEQTILALHGMGYDDLRLTHNSVLIHVEAQGTRITTLAQRARMTKQGMSKLVKEVELLGYVERVPDPEDGRAQLVRLTQRGNALLTDALTHFDAQEAKLKQAIGDRPYDELLDTLKVLAEMFDEDGF